MPPATALPVTIAGRRQFRRVIYQYRVKRARMDLSTIDKTLSKAQRIMDGTAEFKRNRFLRITGAKREINHSLVEGARRMSKSDLKARPVFHHKRESVEAHLTVVFAALAITRYAEHVTGLSIKRLVNTLRPLRTGVLRVNGRRRIVEPHLPPEAKALIDALHAGGCGS